VELPTRRVLSLACAKRIAATCAERAHERGFAIDVAVVDAGGHLVYFERDDGVAPGTVQVAIMKAQSSAAFGVPSQHFEATVAGGLVGMVAIPGMAPFEGAVPIAVDGHVIGAVGVSGVTKEIDGELAQAGADAVAAMLGP
jgi:glc operon protein GlcG